MIDQERLSTFLEALETDDPVWLEEIEQYGRERKIPLVRRETAALLLFILQTAKAKNVLEIGTAVGYSALLMALHGGAGLHIDTVELDAERAALARENFARAKKEGVSASIDLLEGDAGVLLPALSGPYGLIFLDGAKGQYAGYLPALKRLLAPGGVLFADNVLQDGTVLDSRFLVERRDRTTHRRMRDFLYAVKHDPELVTAIVPVGDGVSLSLKKETALPDDNR